MQLENDVSVVGAGPVGMILSIALAKAGLSVALIDRYAVIKTGDHRGISIAYGTKQILEALDLWEPLKKKAEPIKIIHVAEGLYGEPLTYKGTPVVPLGYIIEESYLRKTLRKELAKYPLISTFMPYEVKGLQELPFKMQVILSGDLTLESQLIVAADGKESKIRSLSSLAHYTWNYQQSALVCTLAHEGSHKNIAYEYFYETGPIALLPMQENQSSLVWTHLPDAAQALVHMDEEDFLRELQEKVPNSFGKLTLVSARKSYPLTGGFSPKLYGQRIALVGDAGHVIHPVAGQGVNLGLRDAATLAELLIRYKRLGLDLGSLTMLRKYNELRRFDILSLLGSTDLLVRFFSKDFLKPFRVLGLSTVERIPLLKSFFKKRAMGLFQKHLGIEKGL